MTDPAAAASRPAPPRRRRPRWSTKSSFIYSLCLTGVVSALVLALGRRSIWFELELAVGILAVCFFLFLTYVLYHGVSMDRRERFEFAFIAPPEVGSAWVEFLEAPLSAADDLAGCLGGWVVGLLLALLLALFLPVLLWIGVNLFIATVALLVLPMFFLYRASLRQIVVRGRGCRGRLGKSVRFAAVYTLFGAAGVYAILLAAWYFAVRDNLPGV
jgi:Ca2+/Na+ antiporter